MNGLLVCAELNELVMPSLHDARALGRRGQHVDLGARARLTTHHGRNVLDCKKKAPGQTKPKQSLVDA